MNDISREIDRRFSRCIRRRTKIDVLDSQVMSRPSPEEIEELFRHLFPCFVEVVKRLESKKFSAWMKNQIDELKSQFEEVGLDLLRYYMMTISPEAVFGALSAIGAMQEGVENLVNEELLEDARLVKRLLLLSWLDQARLTLAQRRMTLLYDVVTLANSEIGRDLNWVVSLVALSIEEVLIKSKAKELGISVEKRRSVPRICQDLINEMEQRGLRVNRELLLAPGHRRIRNRVLHEGWQPTKEETEQIVSHVIRLAQYLGSFRTIIFEV